MTHFGGPVCEKGRIELYGRNLLKMRDPQEPRFWALLKRLAEDGGPSKMNGKGITSNQALERITKRARGKEIKLQEVNLPPKIRNLPDQKQIPSITRV